MDQATTTVKSAVGVSPCTFIVERPDGMVKLLLSGELDTVSACAIDELLREQEQVGFDRFVVDLAELRFMDSSGFGVLVAAARRAANAGRSFRVVNASGAVRKMFNLIQADAVFRHLYRLAAQRPEPSAVASGLEYVGSPTFQPRWAAPGAEG